MSNGASKKRVVIVGGMHFNIPRQLHEHFEVVKQIAQGDRKPPQSLPRAELILVLTNWVSHAMIHAARQCLPDARVLYVRKGWNQMSAALVHAGELSPEAVAPAPMDEEQATMATPVDAETQQPAVESGFAGMTDDELERLTRPEPAPVMETPEAGFERVLMAEWRDHVGAWIESPTVKLLGIDTESVRPTFEAVDPRKDDGLSPASFPALQMGTANYLLESFRKSRAGFRRARALVVERAAPVPRPRAKPPVIAEPPVIASPIPNDVTVMLAHVQKLTGRISSINEQIHALEDEKKRALAELDVYKPILGAIEVMQRAVKNIKERVGEKQS